MPITGGVRSGTDAGRPLHRRPPTLRVRAAGPRPHPNPAKAAEGRRLHGLTRDPQTAPVVRRIYAMYLAGYGIFAIAEALTRDDISCPSAYDRTRNPHRDGLAWSRTAVRVASKEPAHEPLVDQADFDRVQEMLTSRARTATAPKRAHRSRHPYIFKSLVFCGVCGRKMQGQHSHGVAYYRCRYPQEYALANKVDHPRNVIMREEVLIRPLDTWLVQEFGPLQRRHTIAKLVGQAATGVPTGPPHRPGRPWPNATPSWAATGQPWRRARTHPWSPVGSPTLKPNGNEPKHARRQQRRRKHPTTSAVSPKTRSSPYSTNSAT
ncbi:MAG TPA: recombinase family protein [Pilimelia sp.]|nr:recombinase family protein [Pilimelia sp.]